MVMVMSTRLESGFMRSVLHPVASQLYATVYNIANDTGFLAMYEHCPISYQHKVVMDTCASGRVRQQPGPRGRR